MATATYIDNNTFSIITSAGPYNTSIWHIGRRVRCNCGIDGYKYGTISSSIVSGGNIVIDLEFGSDSITSNLIDATFGITGSGHTQSIVEHNHNGIDKGGSLTHYSPSGHSHVESDIIDLQSYITSAGVTYENLNLNGDVGTGATQVAQGDHAHAYSEITGTHSNEDHTESYITSAGVTYENLNLNGDVGTGATQVAQGDHAHTSTEITYTNTNWNTTQVGDALDKLTSYNEHAMGSGRISPDDVLSGLQTSTLGVSGGSGYINYNGLHKYITWSVDSIDVSGFTTNRYYVYVDSNGTLQTSAIEPDFEQNIYLGFCYVDETGTLTTVQSSMYIIDNFYNKVMFFMDRLGVFLTGNCSEIKTKSTDSLKLSGSACTAQYGLKAIDLLAVDSDAYTIAPAFKTADYGWQTDYYFFSPLGYNLQVPLDLWNDVTANGKQLLTDVYSFTQYSDTVICSATPSDLEVGDFIYPSGGDAYSTPVIAVSGSTITLKSIYAGTTALSASTYANKAIKPIPAGKYVKHLVIRDLSNTAFIILSQTYYDSQEDALESAGPSPIESIGNVAIKLSHIVASTEETDLTNTLIDIRPLNYYNNIRQESPIYENRYTLHSGFINKHDDSTLLWDLDGSTGYMATPRTFYIYGDYQFRVKGRLYTKSTTITTAEYVQVPSASGVYSIYYNEGGELIVSTDGLSGKELLYDICSVAYLIWYGDLGYPLGVEDQRHGDVMSWETLSYIRNYIGIQWRSGFTLNNFTIGTGNVNADAKYGMTDGYIQDMDTLISIPDDAPQDFAPYLYAPVLYRMGADPTYLLKPADQFPIIYNDGVTWSGTLPPYNQFTGGAWQLTELGNGKYVCYHLVVTKDLEHPVFATIGITSYGTLADAEKGALAEANYLYGEGAGGVEFRRGILPIATIIYQVGSGYSNTPKARIVQLSTGSYYIDWRRHLYDLGTGGTGGGAAGVTNHANLANLSYATAGHTGFLPSTLDTNIGMNQYSNNWTEALTVNQTYSGDIATMTVDTNATGFGAALYMASDGHFDEADADAAATMPCRCLACATGTGSKIVLFRGFMRNDTWNWTPGGTLYVSATTGALTQTAPNGIGDQVQCVGFATHADRIYFNPECTITEVV